MKKTARIIMSGGGTGGHVFPAIAIADAIRELLPGAEILFVGAKGKMEMERVPQAGYAIKGLTIAGFQRRLTAANLLFPFKLMGAMVQAWRIVRKFKPQAAVGTGGYASGPVLKIAAATGVPTVIQEQNSYPGVTNRLLGKKAKRICVAYEEMGQWFPKEKIHLTGNPIRADIVGEKFNHKESAAYFGLDASRPIIFVTGGSLGAKVINESIAIHLESLLQAGAQLIWQTGRLYEAAYRSLGGPSVKVMGFVDHMGMAYAAADIIVSRAGGTISELCVIGKPAILLPSPNVAEDHQTKNVLALSGKDAAILVRDADAESRLGPELIALLKDSDRQKLLSENIKSMARPHASRDIALQVLELIK